jgi:hypothetical protein
MQRCECKLTQSAAAARGPSTFEIDIRETKKEDVFYERGAGRGGGGGGVRWYERRRTGSRSTFVRVSIERSPSQERRSREEVEGGRGGMALDMRR